MASRKPGAGGNYRLSPVTPTSLKFLITGTNGPGRSLRVPTGQHLGPNWGSRGHRLLLDEIAADTEALACLEGKSLNETAHRAPIEAVERRRNYPEFKGLYASEWERLI
ncbi:MAG TPA: hypothetical protein VK217_02165 [Acidimicrobiales bacterium]|nr:hypothetical protein [Acidimicrobiales bacterium]